MTPNDLEVLLHFYAIPGPHPRKEAVGIQILRFVADGILEPLMLKGEKVPDEYVTTSRGDYWLHMILNTPYPEHKWVDPRED